MEKIRCPICNQNKFKHILTSKDNINHIKGNFNIVKCINCSLILTNPRPSLKEIKKYYPDNYQPYKTTFSKTAKIIFLKNKFNFFFNIINPKSTLDLNPKQKKANILEIGCGAGNFLYEQKILHPKWKIIGTDINQKSIDTLNKNKIRAFVSDLTILPVKSKSIDVVYGWMIIEHIHNLNQAISEVHRVLKDNGKFSFSIPNINCWEYKFFNKNWYGLQLPTHLYHFNQNTITKLLKKNGFEMKKIIYQKTFANVFLSIKIVINNNRLPKFLKTFLSSIFNWNNVYYFLTLPIAMLLSTLKQSGRITIIAQKIWNSKKI